MWNGVLTVVNVKVEGRFSIYIDEKIEEMRVPGRNFANMTEEKSVEID